MNKIGLFILALFVSVNAFAANHYIRSGATGNASGADWTNACPDFTGACSSASLVRGDTYFVGGAGPYNGGSTWLNLGTLNSGALTITIQHATIANHGTSTGWNDSFDRQNHFAAGVHLGNVNNMGSGPLSDYWTFDGVVGSGSDPSSYGFVIDQPSACNANQTYISLAGSFITAQHFTATACPDDVEKVGAYFGWTQTPLETNNYLGYAYFSGFQDAVTMILQSTLTIEHIYTTNGFSSSSHHGGIIDPFSTDHVTLRYNVLNQCVGTACLDSNIGSQCAMNHWDVYGNVFSNAMVGNGVIAGTSTNTGWVPCNMKVYNNTFYHNNTTPFWQCDPGAAACSAAVNNVFENNIVANGICGLNQNGGGAIAHDYNTYSGCTDSVPAEANGQTLPSVPFINAGSLNFLLASDTNPWLPLSSPYSTDSVGVLRTSSRGAYQFGNGSTLPTPPAGLVAAVQ